MSPQLTVYGTAISPYVQKVEIALSEAKISYKFCLVDIFNKPAFYKQVNPIGKVPAITYGGPEVDPEEPSPLSKKLTESNVILEFLADAYPEANLAPTDPVQRAKVRLFMDAVTRKYTPVYLAWILNKEPLTQAEERHLKAIEFLQGLLSDNGQYAVGDGYTIADACITPFIYQLRFNIEHDIGKFPEGSGPKFGELLKDPKYAKFMSYANAVLERPVTKAFYASRSEIQKQGSIKWFGRGSTFVLPIEYLQGRA